MRRYQMLLVAAFTLFLVSFSHGQPWIGILDATRAIDWTETGIPGGIPTRAVICSTISAATYGNGSIDATNGIQVALDNCASGATRETQARVLALSAGNFLIKGTISVPSYVTLRGAGADKTVLNAVGADAKTGVINLGKGDPPNPIAYSVAIVGGATANSTSIVVADASRFVVGHLMQVTELNDPTFVTKFGADDGEAGCTWCDAYWNGDRARGQIVEIKSVNGNTVGFSPGLFSTYSHAPQALPFPASVKYSGVEDLQVYENGTHSYSVPNAPFWMTRCAYCWLKGVMVNYTDGDMVKVHWGYRDEIRDSYFSNAYRHGPGQNNNSVFLAFKTTATLVENNIFERLQTPVMINWGAAGNVVAYNYMVGGLDERLAGANNAVMNLIEPHGAHPQFILYESNVLSGFFLDNGHGSSSHSTTFRNWAKGTAFVCPPNIGRATVTCHTGTPTPHWAWQAARAISVDFATTHYNFIGDVLGSAEQSALGYGANAVAIWPAFRNYSMAYGFTFGYNGFGDSGTRGRESPLPYQTSFIHGVFNNIDGSLTWKSGTTRILPPSFYLLGKPKWWPDSIAWPAIGPDVTGGFGPGGHAKVIPAQLCYESVMGGTEGGAGSPLTFNAARCYYAGSNLLPNAPLNLTTH